jgi:hypothetical protein
LPSTNRIWPAQAVAEEEILIDNPVLEPDSTIIAPHPATLPFSRKHPEVRNERRNWQVVVLSPTEAQEIGINTGSANQLQPNRGRAPSIRQQPRQSILQNRQSTPPEDLPVIDRPIQYIVPPPDHVIADQLDHYDLTKAAEILATKVLFEGEQFTPEMFHSLPHDKGMKLVVSLAANRAANYCSEFIDARPFFTSPIWALLPLSQLIDVINKDHIACRVVRTIEPKTEPRMDEMNIFPMMWPDLYLNPSWISEISGGSPHIDTLRGCIQIFLK